MLAESIPRAEQLATKADLEALKADLEALRADLKGWMLGMFVPLWLGVYGTLIGVIVALVVKV